MRLKFVNEGNLRKYIIYAFGEIILIVIGILIAVQINIWKESRKDRILESSYMSRILNDIQQDKINLGNIIKIQEDKLKNNKEFQSKIQFLSNQDKKEIDSLFIFVLDKNYTFYPIIGSYQSTLSDGGIRIFNDKDFISQVINLYDSHYTRLVYNGEVLDEKYFTLTDKYKHERRIKGLVNIKDVNITELIDDFFWFQKQQDYYLKRCHETLDIINMILELHQTKILDN